MSSDSGGLTTGGSIGGGMGINTAFFKDINLSFENLQESKTFESIIKLTPFTTLKKFIGSLKGVNDSISLASLAPASIFTPPVTPLNSNTKIHGIIGSSK
jgi:hypothetical protein